MITILFKCDRCGKEWDTKCIDPLDPNQGSRYTIRLEISGCEAKSAEWCRECVISSGIVNWAPRKHEKPPPVPRTTNEILTELIEHLGFSRGGES